MDLVGMLDIIQAIQSMINKSSMPWTIPTFNDNKSLSLEDMWNPMLSMTKDSDSIVTNSLLLENSSSLLISGPNMGGKTTILRCVGLI